MRCLIVEDEFTSRRILQRLLNQYGSCDVAISGDEAVVAFQESLEHQEPYDLVCLDIMLPGKTGQEVLAAIRELEEQHHVDPGDGVKVIMTTTLTDKTNVMSAFRTGCEAYLVKPLTRDKVASELSKLGLVA